MKITDKPPNTSESITTTICPCQISNGMMPIGEHLDEVVQRQERRRNCQGGQVLGLSTGFSDLDSSIDGLEPGDLMLVGFRTAVGKTSMCLEIATHVSTHLKKSVALFSSEQSPHMLIDRMVCLAEGLDPELYRSISTETFLDDLKWEKYKTGIDKLRNIPLFIDAPYAKTVIELAEFCQKLRLKMPELALIVIDDIRSLYNAEPTYHPDATKTSWILKQLALDIQVPILVSSPLSPGLENHKSKDATLIDFRKWGKLDAYADIVCAINQEWHYNPGYVNHVLDDVCLLKNTRGCTSLVHLKYEGEKSRFENI